MVIGFTLTGHFVKTAAGRNVNLTADNRTNAIFAGLLKELHGTVHIAVIGERDRRHACFLDPPDQVGHATGPVQQAIFTMRMKVDKLRHQTASFLVSDCRNTNLFRQAHPCLPARRSEHCRTHCD